MKLATRARTLMVLAFVAQLPPMVLLLTSGFFYTPWSWLPRIVTQFTAGALACAAVRRLELSERARRVVGYVSLLLLVAMVGLIYLLDAYPITGVLDSGGVVDVLFVPLVITLAIGVGSLPRLLSTRVMVYGGQISFCLYMVHELVHTSWTWAVVQFELTPWHSDSPWKWNIFGLLAIAVAVLEPDVSLRRRARAPLDAQDGRRQARDRECRGRRAGKRQASSDRRWAGRGFGARGVTAGSGAADQLRHTHRLQSGGGGCWSSRLR